MEALKASYGSDSDSDDATVSSKESDRLSSGNVHKVVQITPLPPPPVDLLNLPASIDYSSFQASRVRSFPHVEGYYALHVFIPVIIPAVVRKDISTFVARIASTIPNLFTIDLDIPLENQTFEQMLGIEFHISLGRTVPIKVHQIDSVISMLLQRLQNQRQYWIEFSRWEVFVNDERTRTFLSLEVEGSGLKEITRQVQAVNDVYRLHGLPEFYKDPRPHISLVWALGDISVELLRAVQEERGRVHLSLESPNKNIFACRFRGIKCKIGKKSYDVCKLST
ncbi:U6 snRNA phosphodiesterase-like protein [Wolffia australiana]